MMRTVRWHSLWPLLLMLFPLLTLVFWPAFHDDIAYIPLHSALSVRAGQGFFFDILAPTARPLLQSPLYVLVVGILAFPLPAVSVAPVGLAVTFLGWGTLSIALYYVVASLGRSKTAFFVAVLTSTSPLFVTLSEPNMPWALCLSWLLMWQTWQVSAGVRHSRYAPLLALLLPLCAFRPDSLLLLALMLVVQGVRRRTVPLRMIAFAFAGVLVSSWINRFALGELWALLPLDFQAWWPWCRHWLIDQSILLATAAIGCVLWIAYHRTDRWLIAVLTTWLCAALATQLETPAGIILLLFVAMGVQVLMTVLGGSSSARTPAAILPFLMGSLVLALQLETWTMLFQVRPLDRWHAEADVAAWMMTDNMPEASLLSSARLAVLAGQPAAFFANPDSDDRQMRAQIEGLALPDYVVFSDSNDWLRLAATTWFLEQYVPLQSFPLTTSSTPLTIWGYRYSSHAVGQRQLLHAISPNGLELVGYDMPSRPLVPGESLPITIFLRARWSLVQSVQVIGRLDQFGTNESISESVIEIPGPGSSGQWSSAIVSAETLTLAIPANVPYGAYVVTVSFRDRFGAPLWPVYRDGDENVLDRVSLGILTQPWLEDAGGATRIDARFGGRIQLESFGVENTWTSGSTVTLDLFWRASELPAQEYFVFIHLLDESGELVINENRRPVNGLFPMQAWYPGTLIRDTQSLQVPEGLPAGRYHLQLGLFDLNTGARLPLVNTLGEDVSDQSLPLTIIEIEQ